MKGWKKLILAMGAGAMLLGGGYALAAVPFGSQVTVGCDAIHGVQTYVSGINQHVAVVYNNCTGPDLQPRIKVRVDEARGVLVYQLHDHLAAGGGPAGAIRDLAVLAEYPGWTPVSEAG